MVMIRIQERMAVSTLKIKYLFLLMQMLQILIWALHLIIMKIVLGMKTAHIKMV